MLNTQCGPQGGYLVNGPVKPRRLAVMHASVLLLEELLGVAARPLLMRIQYGGVLNDDLERIPEAFALALKLPVNAHINAVSGSLRFPQNEISFRIECEDFRTVEECATTPEVEATYCQTEDLLGKKVCHFAGWVNDAALVDGYKNPDPPRTDRCTAELGHFMRMGGCMGCWCGAVSLKGGVWTLLDPKIGPHGGVMATRKLADLKPNVAYVRFDRLGCSRDASSDKCPRCEGTVVVPAFRFGPIGGGQLGNTGEGLPDEKCALCGGAGTMEAAIQGAQAIPAEEPKPPLKLLTTEESEKLEQPKRSNRGYEFL